MLREAFRVLKPGGRFAVSDVVIEGELPAAVRADMEALSAAWPARWSRAITCAAWLRSGLKGRASKPTRRYTFADLEATTCSSPEVAALSAEGKAALDGRVMGAFIRAVKPSQAGSCCGPECCVN